MYIRYYSKMCFVCRKRFKLLSRRLSGIGLTPPRRKPKLLYTHTRARVIFSSSRFSVAITRPSPEDRIAAPYRANTRVVVDDGPLLQYCFLPSARAIYNAIICSLVFPALYCVNFHDIYYIIIKFSLFFNTT